MQVYVFDEPVTCDSIYLDISYGKTVISFFYENHFQDDCILKYSPPIRNDIKLDKTIIFDKMIVSSGNIITTIKLFYHGKMVFDRTMGGY